MNSYKNNLKEKYFLDIFSNLSQGLYVDIGKSSPSRNFITKNLYSKGWKGINLDFCVCSSHKVAISRTLDTNLELVTVIERGAEKIGYVCQPNSTQPLSNKAEKSYQRIRIAELAEIFQHFTPPGREVQLLRIAFDGFEQFFLSSNDWDKFKPMIIMVDVSDTNFEVSKVYSWENLLCLAGYVNLYSDNDTRAYVLGVHSKFLGESFKRGEKEEVSLNNMKKLAEISALKSELEKTNFELWEKISELNFVYSTKSWRSTKFIRFIHNQAKLLQREGLNARAQALIRKITVCIVNYLNKNPRLKKAVFYFLYKIGCLGRTRELAISIVYGEDLHHKNLNRQKRISFKKLTPRAQQIYLSIKYSIDQQK
jgi:hypothetical protein